MQCLVEICELTSFCAAPCGNMWFKCQKFCEFKLGIGQICAHMHTQYFTCVAQIPALCVRVIGEARFMRHACLCVCESDGRGQIYAAHRSVRGAPVWCVCVCVCVCV